MFATAKSITELWVTKTDYYTSKTSGEVFAQVQAISPIPEGARGNGNGFEITEYSIEFSLLEQIVFNGAPLRCKFASVVRPIQDRFGKTTNTQVLVELLEVDGKTVGPAARPTAPQQTQRPTQQPASDKPAAEKPSDSSKS